MAELKITPRPTRKTRAKGKKPPIEARLLKAAESLLAKGLSFASMSVEQLTKEAGIARGTFYLHFKDKGELVSRLLDYFVEELAINLGTWAQNAPRAEPQDVMAAVKAMLRTFKEHEMIIIAVRDTKTHDQHVANSYNKMMARIARMAAMSTAAVKSRGASHSDTTDDVAFALGQLIVLYATYLIDNESQESLEKVADTLGHICVHTIFSDNYTEREGN